MNITTALPTIPASPMPASDFVGRDNQQRNLVTESPASDSQGDATQAQTQANGGEAKEAQKSDKQAGRKAEDKPESERSKEEQTEIDEEIQELKQRDAEVRTHEQAHASVGGQYAGSPSYEYEKGPDGKSYATAGEVPIDISDVPGDPQATIQKMAVVRRAALAPAEPSSADRKIAAEAASKTAAARAELAKQNAPGAEDEDSEGTKVQGPQTKSLKGKGEEASEQSDSAASSQAERKTLSAEQRSLMIADFYQKRVSPSETGFSATA